MKKGEDSIREFWDTILLTNICKYKGPSRIIISLNRPISLAKANHLTMPNSKNWGSTILQCTLKDES